MPNTTNDATSCPHGCPYTNVECQYSCSHWTRRQIAPNEVIARYMKTMLTAYQDAQCIPHQLDVSYGPSDNEKLDIYGAEALPSDAPVFAFVHGGYWQEGSRKVACAMVEPVTSAGAVAIAIGYDLAPTVSMDDMVGQVVKAIRFVHDWAVKRGSCGVYVCGHSAGAHLVAMSLLRIDQELERLRGAALLSGVYDLLPMKDTYIIKHFKMSDQTIFMNSPLNFVPDLAKYNSRVLFLVAVGADESSTVRNNSLTFHQALLTSGSSLAIAPIYHVFSEEDHFTLVENRDCWQQILLFMLK